MKPSNEIKKIADELTQDTAETEETLHNGIKNFIIRYDNWSVLAKKLGIDELTASFIIQRVKSTTSDRIKKFIITGK